MEFQRDHRGAGNFEFLANVIFKLFFAALTLLLEINSSLATLFTATAINIC